MSLDVELYIAERIADAAGTTLVGIFDGITDPTERRERVRRAIKRHRLESRRLGKRDGKDESFQQFFERMFHQPL